MAIIDRQINICVQQNEKREWHTTFVLAWKLGHLDNTLAAERRHDWCVHVGANALARLRMWSQHEEQAVLKRRVGLPTWR